ncbi:MAG: amidohydrolase family protein [Thermosulfidibacteraceae bacterium]|jgi:predicted TIM-barrel fold metal-dependent hydrolase
MAPKIFDAHFHIIDYRFPLEPNEGYLPESFTVFDYIDFFKGKDIAGGVVVAGSFHGKDYTHITDSIESLRRALGVDFVGVINPMEDIFVNIEMLNSYGIRGVRYNVRRCGKEVLNNLESVAHFIYERAKWHVDIYMENKMLKEYKGLIKLLPKVVIDHFGLTYEGFDDLLDLVSNGLKVKASGFGRVDFDWMWALKAIVEVDPNSPIFGTDVPGTRVGKKFDWSIVESIRNSFDEEVASRILYLNGLEFYLG